MFDKKYNKVLELLDRKIEFASTMHDYWLHKNDNVKLSDEQLYKECMVRGNQWSQVDKYQAELGVLCELRRDIEVLVEKGFIKSR